MMTDQVENQIGRVQRVLRSAKAKARSQTEMEDFFAIKQKITSIRVIEKYAIL